MSARGGDLRATYRLQLTSEFGFEQARALVPYLRALTTLAGGGKRLPGGLERFRLTLGLQAGSESSSQ